jgi:hypothetical protein
MYMLMAFAPAAANHPPTNVQTISQTEGHPLCAKTMVGMVITKSNSTMRGFVNAMYEPTFERWAAGLSPWLNSLVVKRDGTRGRTPRATAQGYGTMEW